MKNLFHLAGISLAVLTAIACQSTPSQRQTETSADGEPVQTLADTTRYGICGDGTSTRILELITNDGDTLYYNFNMDDRQVVRGGLMTGDRIAVISDTDEYGEQRATIVLNLTSLLGRWKSLDKDFEVQEGGTVSSYVQAETSPWTRWKVLNGQLLFDRDTFDVIELGADSLYLENDYGIFVYKRQP